MRKLKPGDVDFGRLPQDGGLRLCINPMVIADPLVDVVGSQLLFTKSKYSFVSFNLHSGPQRSLLLLSSYSLNLRLIVPVMPRFKQQHLTVLIISIYCLQIWAGWLSGSADLGWTSPVSGLGCGQSV